MRKQTFTQRRYICRIAARLDETGQNMCYSVVLNVEQYVALKFLSLRSFYNNQRQQRRLLSNNR